MILKNGKRIDGLGDNMPIGSIVEYNGTDIPDGWEILPGDANVYIGPTEPAEGQEVWIQKSRNLFNINGEVNLSCSSGVILSGANVVSGNVLTATQNTYYTHNVGQQFTNLKGKTFTISAKVLSNGTGKSGYIAIYEDYGRVAGHNIYAGETGSFSWTGKSDNIIIGFATATGENAQFTDIQIELGDERTEYEPYVEKKIYVKSNNDYEEFYNGEEDIYSQEERRIGRWINGKPIYRKCFTLDTRIALGNGHTKMTSLAEQGIVDWEDITHISFTVKDDHAGYFSDGFYTDETDASRCWVSSDWVMFLCGTIYGCGDTTFIIEYTKTTD